MPPLFNDPEVLPLSDKAKLLTKNFSKYSNLKDSVIFLPAFPSRANLKLHVSVTSKMVKKIIINFDFQRCLVLI